MWFDEVYHPLASALCGNFDEGTRRADSSCPFIASQRGRPIGPRFARTRWLLAMTEERSQFFPASAIPAAAKQIAFFGDQSQVALWERATRSGMSRGAAQ